MLMAVFYVRKFREDITLANFCKILVRGDFEYL
nr:MAG TPA: hypothetical protein [Caudoviricetes sp.]